MGWLAFAWGVSVVGAFVAGFFVGRDSQRRNGSGNGDNGARARRVA